MHWPVEVTFTQLAFTWNVELGNAVLIPTHPSFEIVIREVDEVKSNISKEPVAFTMPALRISNRFAPVFVEKIDNEGEEVER